MVPLNRIRLFWLLLFLLFLSSTLNAGLICRFLWTQRTRTRSVITRIGLSLAAAALVFFCLEFTYAFIVVRPDGFGHTLSMRLWYRRYWHPINSHGYRDYETKDLKGRSVVAVVGDSFAAGHGIRDIEDRFANKLARMLGSRWEHLVIADCGWYTTPELEALTSQPIVPDLIVLSYYINDIEGAARKQGFAAPRHFEQPTGLVGRITANSFLLNYVYWRAHRRSFGSEYWDYLRACYSDEQIWNAHASELEAFVAHARSTGAPLCVVVWPHLAYISQSREFTTKVVAFLRNRGVAVIDLAERFRGRAAGELTLNPLDAHPNVATHSLVAQLLYHELLRALPAQHPTGASPRPCQADTASPKSGPP